VWGERAAEVLAAYRRLTTSAPAELTAAVFVVQAPPDLPERWHGKPVVGLLVAHTGADPEADLAAVRALPDPIVDVIGEVPYLELQSMFDGELPAGHHYGLKSALLPGLSAGFLDAFAAAAVDVPPPPSEAMIVHIGGRLNQLAADDGAVDNRDTHYICWFDGAHAADVATDSPATWTRNSWQAVRPFSTGRSYLNFQMGGDRTGRDEELVRTTYGANFARLLQAKRRYDPHNVFRTNRNVSTN
jgi:FAD/FMN-containing dehydrogenase